jgi:hypothetical protein
MHILDDPTGLSARAQNLLERTGWREQPQDPRISTDHLQTRDRGGQLIPSPMLLRIRREGFDLRYAGLRYRVRDSHTLRGERHESVRDWDYDLGRYLWADPTGGGYFDWIGERISTPVRYLIHTDGRVGVEDGNTVFLEIAPSIHALIESHALIDMLSTWDRGPSGRDTLHVARSLHGLQDIPEASGPTVRWKLSDNVAVQEFQNWSSTQPRQWRAFIWCHGKAGQLQVQEATTLAGTTPTT